MMDANTIRAIAQENARKAKRHGKQPWHPETLEDITIENLSKIPFLGTYIPKGWERGPEDEDFDSHGTWFVDSSGWGKPGELALTIEQFVEKAKDWFSRNPAGGFAITESGQFQVYISSYLKKPSSNYLTKRHNAVSLAV